jgi:ribosomal subunit interface protein
MRWPHDLYGVALALASASGFDSMGEDIMDRRPNITFRNMQTSAALEQRICQRAAKLERHFPDISHVDVVVEMPHRDRHLGRHLEIHIAMKVPGGDVVVSRDRAHVLDEAHVAVREAFDAAERRLKDLTGRGHSVAAPA